MMLMIFNVFVYIKSKFSEGIQAYCYVGIAVQSEEPIEDKTVSLIGSGIFGKTQRVGILPSPASKALYTGNTKAAFYEAILLFWQLPGFTSTMASIPKVNDILPHINKSICS